MEKKLVQDKNKLFANKESVCHWVQIEPESEEYLKVWIKEPTFFEIEQAQTKVFDLNMNAGMQDVKLNLSELYRYLFETFVEKTEPNLSTIDLLRLNPYVGNQIKEILPNPFDLMEEGGERKN
tara:strand:+ start:67 stop:435 length:369 start_codon:yes stop_codon:yes gene_type:complete